MTTVDQKVEVVGSSNQIDVAGRDINYFQREPDFVEPDLDAYAPPRYPSHRIGPRLVAAVERERLILMGGTPLIDMASLARYVARGLLAKIGDGTLTVKEWLPQASVSSLAGAIRDTADATLFLLIDLHPRDIQSDLSRMRHVAGSRHYVIATTSDNESAWKLDVATEKHLWHDLHVDEVYDDALLLDELRDNLRQQQGALPKPFDGIVLKDTPLVGTMSLQDIAASLQTPIQVAVFVGLLRHETDPLGERRLNELIAVATDPARIVKQSFRSLDDTAKRLAVLGFSMCQGLLDDQVFAALERLYLEGWRVRNPSLEVPDYCDVDFLRDTFYRFVETARGGTLVEPLFEKQRHMLIEAAWHTNRRQLLGALPVLTALAVESVAQDAPARNRELFGGPDLRRRLRDAVADTLSDLGRISPDAVESSLLTLAAHENVGVQAVAARAMAQWRAYRLDERLFAQLRRWHEGADALKTLRLWFEQSQRTAQPEDYLRATIVLTLGYAAQHDPSDALDPAIVNRLVAFVDDRSPVVRNAFRNGALPLVVPAHASQLRNELRDMTRHLDLVDPIARSLGRAYRSNPGEIWDILDDWYRDAMARPKSTADSFQNIEREGLLVTVVLAYAYLDVEEFHGDIVTERLKHVLSHESHPIVRQGMLIGIQYLAKQDFPRVAEMLRQIVDGVREEEMDVIANALLTIFQQQRAELPDGDDWLEFREVRYPIWVDRERPVTAIEEELLRWLTKPDSTELAKQVALRCWLRFEDFMHEAEETRIREVREARLQRDAENAQHDDSDVAAPKMTPVARSSRATRLITLFAPGDYATLRALMSQALAYVQRREVMDAVLDRWQGHKDAEVSRLARLLKKAMKWHSWLPFCLVATAIGCGAAKLPVLFVTFCA